MTVNSRTRSGTREHSMLQRFAELMMSTENRLIIDAPQINKSEAKLHAPHLGSIDRTQRLMNTSLTSGRGRVGVSDISCTIVALLAFCELGRQEETYKADLPLVCQDSSTKNPSVRPYKWFRRKVYTKRPGTTATADDIASEPGLLIRI